MSDPIKEPAKKVAAPSLSEIERIMDLIFASVKEKLNEIRARLPEEARSHIDTDAFVDNLVRQAYDRFRLEMTDAVVLQVKNAIITGKGPARRNPVALA